MVVLHNPGLSRQPINNNNNNNNGRPTGSEMINLFNLGASTFGRDFVHLWVEKSIATTALLDSGASISVISYRLFNRLPYHIKERMESTNVAGRDFSNNMIQFHGQIKLALYSDQHHYIGSWWFVVSSISPYDIVLGDNFRSTDGSNCKWIRTADGVGGSITVNNVKLTTIRRPPRDDQSVVRVGKGHSKGVVIEKLSATRVRSFYLPPVANGTYILASNGSKSNLADKQLFIPPTIIDVEDRRILSPVYIISFANQAIRLPRGSMIGSLFTLDDAVQMLDMSSMEESPVQCTVPGVNVLESITADTHATPAGIMIQTADPGVMNDHEFIDYVLSDLAAVPDKDDIDINNMDGFQVKCVKLRYLLNRVDKSIPSSDLRSLAMILLKYVDVFVFDDKELTGEVKIPPVEIGG